MDLSSIPNTASFLQGPVDAFPAAVTSLDRDHYSSLAGSRSIRILVLEPGEGNAPIRCRLRQVVLGPNIPQYEAISYT